MNLITEAWIPVIRLNQEKDLIAPWQIVEVDNPVIEIKAPRPDFQGALYQFLIGLLQTCFAPEDEEEWADYWHQPPTPEKLKDRFDALSFAFELHNQNGPAFLQDYDLPEGEIKGVSALLIDAPGGKTQKDNLDHFVKRGQVNKLCCGCTATALLTLQTNAPSGGVGHRVGLRGGGPLTTLLRPQNESTTLWQNLWLNVLNQEDMPLSDTLDSAVLPWLGATRISDKHGVITTPGDVHPLQMYWGTPRRIRLSKAIENDLCDLCGIQAEQLFVEYRSKNYGTNYEGAWVHPLTPYRFDSEKKKPPLSLKGQQGGLGYRHWPAMALQDSETGARAATIVQFYNEERGRALGASYAAIWCFGYDMDNMKARCWYEAQLPVFYLEKNQRNNLMNWVGELIHAAKETVKILRTVVKFALFRRPDDVKGDMSHIDAQFWQATEADFYRLLEQLVSLPSDTRMAPAEIYLSWFQTLQRMLFRVFETATLEAMPEDLDLKRIVNAQNTMRKKFYGNKTIKHLKAKSTTEEVA